MTTITITLSDERLAKLKKVAEQLQVPPEDLARIGIEDLLSRPEETFQNTVDYVLRKNAELYRRLA